MKDELEMEINGTKHELMMLSVKAEMNKLNESRQNSSYKKSSNAQKPPSGTSVNSSSSARTPQNKGNHVKFNPRTESSKSIPSSTKEVEEPFRFSNPEPRTPRNTHNGDDSSAIDEDELQLLNDLEESGARSVSRGYT